MHFHPGTLSSGAPARAEGKDLQEQLLRELHREKLCPAPRKLCPEHGDSRGMRARQAGRRHRISAKKQGRTVLGRNGRVQVAGGCRGAYVGGGHELPWASHRQFQTALKQMKTTHPTPKLQSKRGPPGTSAHTHLRKGGNC